MLKKVRMSKSFLLIIIFFLALVFVLGACSGADEKSLNGGDEVVWSDNHKPDTIEKAESTMQELEKRLYQIRDELIDNQITDEALLIFEEQWETLMSLAKDELIENGISEEELFEWEERQKEKFQAWKEPLIIVESFGVA